MKYFLLILLVLLTQLYSCPPYYEGQYRKYYKGGLKTYLKDCKKCHGGTWKFAQKYTYNEWENIFSNHANILIKAHKNTETEQYFVSTKFIKKSLLLKQALQDYSKRSEEIIILPSFLEKACLEGDTSVCLDLGSYYNAGRDFTTNLRCEINATKSKMYYQIGGSSIKNECANGNANACYSLAIEYHDRAQGHEDKLKAKELYILACSLGIGKACTDANMLFGIWLGRPDANKLYKILGQEIITKTRNE